MAVTDKIVTYSFTETLSDSEKVSGQFTVDYTYNGTSLVSETMKAESITASGGKDYLDTTFSNTGTITNNNGTFSFELGGTNTYSVGTSLGMTFTDSSIGSASHSATIIASNETNSVLNHPYSETAASMASIPCYAKGTFIATSESSVPVERLQEGDLVLTLSGDLEPIQWVGQRTVDCKRYDAPGEVNPVRICKGAFAENQPSRDLFLSPLHSVYVNGIFVPAIDLVNDLTVFQEDRSKITYYHVELSSHNVIYAEGLPAETYLDDNNRSFFVGGSDGEVVQLDTNIPPMVSAEIWEQKGFAKVMREGAEVEAIRAQLLERATILLDNLERQVA